MGDHKTNIESTDQERAVFIGHLLADLESLNYMLEHNLIEDDIVRIGAEQEFCLLNDHWRPAKNSMAILDEIDDPHFTTELARYNIEINLDPFKLEGDAFTQVENQLTSLLQKAETLAEKHGDKILLTGILPSISKHELNLNFMTPVPRYFALNNLLKHSRGSEFRMRFKGVDELSIMHNSVMFEACNTSFQMHLQISPNDFASSYNWAQAISGPVLAACVNSPLLLGNELWSETRIALFQQSIDTRKVSFAQLSQQPRVTFGDDWVSGTVYDFYRDEISKYQILLTKEIEESSLDMLKQGNTPKLRALNLHNGTIYRWNRPCYGVGNGKAHIRIENRYIPSGPSIADEIANFAFWVGLMKGRPAEYDDVTDKMDFADAKSNFIKAARYGSETIMNWMGENIPLEQLIIEELLPIARRGLEQMNIDKDDIDKTLNLIQERIETNTGSQWIVRNYRDLKKELRTDDALIALTQGMYNNQQNYTAISDWPAKINVSDFSSKATKVGHIMSTSLITADQRDSAVLTLQFMKWNNIHHLPVVTSQDDLVGLITWRHVNEHWDVVNDNMNTHLAADVMTKNVITVSTSTAIQSAISLMKEKEIGCLPVLQNNQLVGIITIKDVISFDNA